MSKSITIFNLDSVIDAFRLFPKEINEALEESSIEIGEDLTVEARDQQNHEWRHRFNNLEKDIGNRVTNSNGSVTLTFGLGFYPSQTRVNWGGNLVSYGTILHDGPFDDPWIEETFDRNTNKIEKEYNEALDTVIQRLF